MVLKGIVDDGLLEPRGKPQHGAIQLSPPGGRRAVEPVGCQRPAACQLCRTAAQRVARRDRGVDDEPRGGAHGDRVWVGAAKATFAGQGFEVLREDGANDALGGAVFVARPGDLERLLSKMVGRWVRLRGRNGVWGIWKEWSGWGVVGEGRVRALQGQGRQGRARRTGATTTGRADGTVVEVGQAGRWHLFRDVYRDGFALKRLDEAVETERQAGARHRRCAPPRPHDWYLSPNFARRAMN